MADRPNIDIPLLRQLLAYDPETGALTWLKRPRELFPTLRAWAIWNGRYAGTAALAANSNGARQGNIFARRTYAHRAAWALYHGAWPEGVIDHINGNPADNRIVNLRDVPQATNMRNQNERNTNTSGVTGVVPYWSKWKAQITVDGRNINLGHFRTRDEAIVARKAAERRHGFHPNHGRAACQN